MQTLEASENSQKMMKTKDLESVFCSQAEAAYLDATPDSRATDLNVTVGTAKSMTNDDATSCIQEFCKRPASEKEEMERKNAFSKAKGRTLDLNADEMSSSNNNDPFYPYKNYELLKQREDFESGSSVGPLEENDSITRQYKKMKQNDYARASYGHMQMPFQVPKARGRKSKNDVHKRKLEIAKREQIDRFAQAAAPSDLLNGLNPGIINHVRNSKQVHSILEAVAKLARTEKEQFGSQQDYRNKAGTGTKDAKVGRSGVIRGEILSGSMQIRDFHMGSKSISLSSEVKRGSGNSHLGKTKSFVRSWAQSVVKNKDDALVLSTSASVESEKTLSLSNEESANSTSVSSLSVKAANVASQWLELLNQDIKGRLAALSQSKQRVRDVIQTVLPHLLSREFTGCDEKDPYTTNESNIYNKATVEAHRVRWFKHFEVIDIALSEEEGHLESWLNEVKALQFHCESGLFGSSQPMDPLGNGSRLEGANNSEKYLAVGAAAASIYSTCNYLMSMEN